MADAVAAVERPLLVEKHGDTNPHADAAVDAIVNRWKVRYHLSRLAKPIATCVTAPDIRSTFLHQRAEFLNQDRNIGSAPRVQDELADALLELASTRDTVHQLQTEAKDLNAALDAERKKNAESESKISELESRLAAQEKDLAALRADLAVAQEAAGAAPPQRHRGSSFRQTPSDHHDRSAPPPNSPAPAPQQATYATSVGTPPHGNRTATPTRRTIRSPARVPPPTSTPPAQGSPSRRKPFV